ncbi:MAG: glycosyltransferase family 2 protein [Rhodobacterales bacterium]|nr:glycosyltransferase family 2 protein [Rhodobacterales bacterium]MDX5498732.1 glycosyltransferase family 2 protein [Rhodobacterales bacterium]
MTTARSGEAPEGDYPLEKEIVRRLRHQLAPAPVGMARYPPVFLLRLGLLLAVLWGVAVLLPNRFLGPDTLHITLALGVLGTWRFGWWFNHALRSDAYRRMLWPPKRDAADRIWHQGWRPRRLHIQMTTYKEEKAITRLVLISILAQIRRERVPTSIWIGTGSAQDEVNIREVIETYASDIPDDLAEVIFVRQNQPGKRMAIGLILRGISRHGVEPDDLVIFMDGDAVYGPDVLEKTLSMFGADPDLQALTTDEEVMCFGPAWIEKWLTMRFAQRRLAMESHAVSDRVLTLTGRFSVFRARHIIDPQFIRTIEADHLDHWLWGRFRFLSGDDKSTWYHLLSKGAKMTYVPDACVYTIEIIKGSGLQRMVENFRRWSGNMLRNGSRAIALGPAVVPPFIWWCVVDQRIAMWTMLVSPILAIYGTILDPLYATNVFLWVIASRLFLSAWLWRYAREPDLAWPFILYFNQLINAGVKIYMLFHLAKQKWFNRGVQSVGGRRNRMDAVRDHVALFQLITSVAAFATFLGIYAGVLPAPF